MDTKSGRQRTLDIKVGVLQQEVVQLKRERNKLSPISGLPVDILRSIFFLSVRPLALFEDWETSPDYVQLCHVCHAWRVVALDSPELWTCVQIRAHVEPSLLEFQLKNTKEALLDIECCDPSSSDSQLDVVSSIIREYAAKRLRSLKIYAMEIQISQLLEGTNEPAEMLEESVIYDLQLSQSRSERICEDIFGGGLPKLRRLRSNRVLPWSSSLLTSPNFTELSMGSDDFDECRITRPYIQQLLAFLSRSPQLRSLALAFAPTGVVEDDAIWTPIKLPSLKALQIGAADPEPFCLLLPLLLPDPDIQSVYFGLTQASSKAEVAEASAASIHLLHCLNSPQQLYITCKDNHRRGMEMKAWRYPTFTGEYKAGEPTLDSKAFAIFAVSPLEYAQNRPGRLLGDPRDFELDWWLSDIRTVVIHNMDPTPAFWTVLAARPALQCLSVTLPEQEMRSVLSDVLRGTKSQGDVKDSVLGIPFAALRSLYLGTQSNKSEESLQNVRKYTLDALNGRKTFNLRDSGEHPLDLQELALVNCLTSVMEEDLVDFLGVASKVVWRLETEKGAPSASAQDVEVVHE